MADFVARLNTLFEPIGEFFLIQAELFSVGTVRTQGVHRNAGKFGAVFHNRKTVVVIAFFAEWLEFDE